MKSTTIILKAEIDLSHDRRFASGTTDGLVLGIDEGMDEGSAYGSTENTVLDR